MTKIDITKFNELDKNVKKEIETLAKDSNAYLI